MPSRLTAQAQRVEHVGGANGGEEWSDHPFSDSKAAAFRERSIIEFKGGSAEEAVTAAKSSLVNR